MLASDLNRANLNPSDNYLTPKRIKFISMNVTLEKAKSVHINDVCDLINIAYRGERGWTTEASIVGGNRTTPREIETILKDPNKNLLVSSQSGELLACICIERKSDYSSIGMLAVNPKYQGFGIGKQVLAQAEDFSKTSLGLYKFEMVVVSSRVELISFYERRGYRLSGETSDYPVHLNVGTPKIDGLSLVYLQKTAGK